MMQDAAPLVSVVVPTYRRADLLARCLAALLRQTLPPQAYEIIVCDDGPGQAVRQAVAQARACAPRGLALHYHAVRDTQGPAGARNVGWRSARAPIVAFTDDDTVPDPQWLQAGLRAMADGAGAASGRIVMPLPERPTDCERDAARLQEAEFATANCFVLRAALEAVDGFDERFTIAWREDSDLHFSLLRDGWRIVRAPEAVVVHPLRAARFGAGVGMQRKIMFDVLLYCKHPRLYRQRIRRHPPWLYLAVCASLVAAVGTFLAGWHGTALAAALSWAVLSLLFFFRRLRGSAPTLRNLAELFVTSALIPPLSIFWRLVGALRFGRALP